jgi:hypothetical protein
MMKKGMILFVWVSATLLLTSCSGKPVPEVKEKIIPVKTLRVAASAVAGERSYVGTVEESAALSLSFSVPGSDFGRVERLACHQKEATRSTASRKHPTRAIGTHTTANAANR